MMKAWSLILTSLTLGATLTFAQEEEAKAQKPVRFNAMIEVQGFEKGSINVQLPNAKQDATEAVGNYMAYPYGSTFTVQADTKAKFIFSDLSFIAVKGPAVFTTFNKDEFNTVGIKVKRGNYIFTVEKNAIDGQFAVETPLGNFTSLKGRTRLNVSDLGKGTIAKEDFNFTTVAGSANFEGVNFTMKNLPQAASFTSEDTLSRATTHLKGSDGRIDVALPNGQDATNFELTQGCTVKISRAKAAGSPNWVVSVLTLYANGEAKNYFCYVENRTGDQFRTGELIATLNEEITEEAAEGDAQTGDAPAEDDFSDEDFGDELE